MTQAQKRSLHTRRRITDPNLSAHSIPDSGPDEEIDEQYPISESHIPAPTGGETSDGNLIPPDASGGVDD